jgi:predicted Zn-dependent protease
MRLVVKRSACLLLCALACVSTDLAPITDPAFAPQEDELSLWQNADQIDASLENGGYLLPDAELDGYLDRVAGRLLGASGARPLPVRVRVLLDPYANAFALPNGSIYLHSGLLAPIESEAQLASVLGHELAHYTGRHALREQRAQKNRETARNVAVTVVALLVAAGGNAYAAFGWAEMSNDLSNLIMRLQVAGYSRDLEPRARGRRAEPGAAARRRLRPGAGARRLRAARRGCRCDGRPDSVRLREPPEDRGAHREPGDAPRRRASASQRSKRGLE